jgi:hypothetical protein
MAVPYYIDISGLYDCNVLYRYLWPVWPYRIISISVASMTVPYYIDISGLYDCTVLYRYQWPVWPYRIISISVSSMTVPYYIDISGPYGRTVFSILFHKQRNGRWNRMFNIKCVLILCTAAVSTLFWYYVQLQSAHCSDILYSCSQHTVLIICTAAVSTLFWYYVQLQSAHCSDIMYSCSQHTVLIFCTAAVSTLFWYYVQLQSAHSSDILYSCSQHTLLTFCTAAVSTLFGVRIIQRKFTINVCLMYSNKAIPLQARTGLEGSIRLSLPDFKTIGTWRW